MNMLLIRMMNLPVFLRRVSALMIAALLLVVGGLAAWLPVSFLQNRSEQILEMRSELGRYLHVVETQTLAAETTEISEDGRLFLKGRDEGVVQADLQSRLGALSSRNRADVISVAAAPSYEANGVRYIGIKVSLGGTISAIHNVVFAIENSVPALVIDSARLSSQRSSRRRVAEQTEPKINAQLTVFGAVDIQVEDGS